ncbi:13319_t:CDS:2, partial [Funneliformis geosporum]
DDESMFKELIKDFYDKIINTISFDNFENSSIEWIKNTLKQNDLNVETSLEFMQNHEESEAWFTSLIGFFYQHGIGCNVNEDVALKMYSLAIKQVQIVNNTIAKYLLSLLYYKDIILSKGNSGNSIDLTIIKPKVKISQFKNFKNINKSNANVIDDERKNYSKLLLNLNFDNNNPETCSNEEEEIINLDFNRQHEMEIEKKKFERYIISARGGDVTAKYKLGRCYQYNKGIDKDEGKAFEWYLESAVNGNASGQRKLGDCYQYGKGAIIDEKKAFEWYSKSAENGSSNGQRKSGRCYLYGIGIEKDEKKALELYLKSAEAGNVTALYNLGHEKKAFVWYSKSAENGSSNGQRKLGRCYQYAIDEKKAFEWFLKSAELGSISAQNSLDDCYQEQIKTL